MSLYVSSVPRALEKKTRLLGFEIGDLLLVFLYLTTSNFLFGQTQAKFLLVWCGTIALALSLYFLKKGKPDNYIQHYSEYLISGGIYSSAATDIEYSTVFTLDELED